MGGYRCIRINVPYQMWVKAGNDRRTIRAYQTPRFRTGNDKGDEMMKKNYYLAMMEVDTDKLTEGTGTRIAAAMEELKSSFAGYGEVTYYNVASEEQYRKAEHELKSQAK